ncbi:MAG TPA: hypothetical protein PLL81_04815 [Bacillota bacterium]|nr:hypothetical protein [Bacillota bacterium]
MVIRVLQPGWLLSFLANGCMVVGSVLGFIGIASYRSRNDV